MSRAWSGSAARTALGEKPIAAPTASKRQNIEHPTSNVELGSGRCVVGVLSSMFEVGCSMFNVRSFLVGSYVTQFHRLAQRGHFVPGRNKFLPDVALVAGVSNGFHYRDIIDFLVVVQLAA